MTLHREAKQTAKKALEGVWGTPVALTLGALGVMMSATFLQSLTAMLLEIPFFEDTLGTPSYYLDDAVNLSPASVSHTIVSFILVWAVFSAVSTAYKGWYFYRSYGNLPPFSSLFDVLAHPRATVKTAGAFILRFFVNFAVFAVLIAPAAAVHRYIADVSASRSLTDRDNLMLLMLSVLVAFLAVCSLAGAFVQSRRFFLLPYIIAADPDISALGALSASARAMKGFKGDAAVLSFSFIPAYASVLLALPALFVLPYSAMTHAVYARFILEQSDIFTASDTVSEELPQTDSPDDRSPEFENACDFAGIAAPAEEIAGAHDENNLSEALDTFFTDWEDNAPDGDR